MTREATLDGRQCDIAGGQSDIGNVDARIVSQLEQVRDIISKHS